MFRKFSLTVAVVVCFIANVFANTPKIILSTTEEKVLTFEFEAQKEATVIKMFDVESEVVYYEEIDGQKFISKKFDLKRLDKGTFYMSVETEFKELIYTISLTEESVKIIAEEEKSKPFFRKKEDRVSLNFLNVDEGKVTVKIFSGDNRTVYSETFENEPIVSKTFNFQNALADTYTIIVKKGATSYYERVVIN
jgi:prolyl oligopeptidase PreP (S9A serine peptidase family)